MRIKKKHVLLESLLIDVTNEFTPIEKKIFKMLRKHYGNPMEKEEGKKDFNQWHVAAWLIETLEIPYQEAHTLSKTYFWNYNKLFGEVGKLRKKVGIPFLFFEHYRNIFDEVSKSYDGNILTNVVIDFDRDSGFEDNREVHFWGRFKGFTLYIPMNNNLNDTYLYSSETNPRLILVTAEYSPISKDGIKVDGYISDENWSTEIDENEFMVSVDVEVGGERSEKQKIDSFMVFSAPYPKELTIENFKEINESIVGDVLEKLSETVFNLHPDVESINVDTQPD